MKLVFMNTDNGKIAEYDVGSEFDMSASGLEIECLGVEEHFDNIGMKLVSNESALEAENAALRQRVAELEAGYDLAIDWIDEHTNHTDWCIEEAEPRSCICGRDKVIILANKLLKESETE